MPSRTVVTEIASPETAPTLAGSPSATSPTPQPTPTPRLSEIERVSNGDFEKGDTGWYEEKGAAVKETEATSGTHALVLPVKDAYADQPIHFLTGTTYQLSAWGKAAGAGIDAVIGVVYLDANEKRMTNIEPTPMTFTAQTFVQQAMSFTVPADVIGIKVYIWRSAGTGSFTVDDVSVRSEVSTQGVRPAAASSDDGAINILLMGVDARPGEAIDIGVRPDSLMVLRLNPKAGSCKILSIPRDTRADLPGYGLTKINHALAVGGIPYEQQVVENFTGLSIDHYFLIDFTGFQDLVDAVGGVSINVPEGFVAGSGNTFVAGQQSMNGHQALEYARFRGGPDGDFGRIARQQQVLQALIRKTEGLNAVTSLNELLPAVSDHIRTDLNVSEMARIILDYRNTCTESSLHLLRLEGYDAWFDDPLLQLQLEYVVVDEAEVERKVEMLLEP